MKKQKHLANFCLKAKVRYLYTDDDYLMGADVDYKNLEVQEDVTNWGNWIINEIGLTDFA